MEQLSALLWSTCLYELDQKWPHIFIMHLELVSVYISNVERGVEFNWLFLRWGTTTHADTCTVSVSPYVPFRVSLNCVLRTLSWCARVLTARVSVQDVFKDHLLCLSGQRDWVCLWACLLMYVSGQCLQS